MDWFVNSKQAQTRLSKVLEALVILESWLEDIFREGLATACQRPLSFWETMAKTMTDFQAKGLASMIRSLPLKQDLHNLKSFEMLYEQLSMIYLLIKTFKKFDTFPTAFQADLLRIAGITLKKQDIITYAKTVEDNWFVLSVHEYQETKQLTARKIWLVGQFSKQFAYILDFKYGRTDFEERYKSGQWLEATLAFYPSIYPLRALVQKNKAFAYLDAKPFVYSDFQTFLMVYAQALSSLPWLLELPLGFSGVLMQDMTLVDKHGHIIPFCPDYDKQWPLIGFSELQTFSVFGEWNGYYFQPFSVWNDQRFIEL